MDFFSGLSVKELMVAEPVVVSPRQPVQEVVHLMNERRIGAVLVGEGGHIDGIFTERDFLRYAASGPCDWVQRPVSDWMTRDPTTVASKLSVEEAMALMDRLHVRHLPVVDNGRIAGLLTSRDLMRRRAEYLNRVVEERTKELRDANDRLQERDAELRVHMVVAGRLQARLLPAMPPDWPEIAWGTHYTPLDPLGGDYYDFAQPDDRHLGILMADASGHSIPAAMVAIMARTAFASAASRRTQPAAVLAAMNRQLHGLTGEHFVTAFYGVLDRQTRLFTFANAGHPFPLRYDFKRGICHTLVAHGLMLGIMPDEPYDESQLRLECGDRLLFYTDGVVDSVGENDRTFGTARLEEYFAECGRESAATIAQRLADRLKTYRGGKPASDDLTILAAEIKV